MPPRAPPLDACQPRAHIGAMNYVLALFVPPLSIALAGRVLLAVVVTLVWIPAILISGGLSHPVFIVLAWILIHQAHGDRRHREAARGLYDD